MVTEQRVANATVAAVVSIAGVQATNRSDLFLNDSAMTEIAGRLCRRTIVWIMPFAFSYLSSRTILAFATEPFRLLPGRPQSISPGA